MVKTISLNPYISTVLSSMIGSGVRIGFAILHLGIGATGPDGGVLILAGAIMTTGYISMYGTMVIPAAPTDMLAPNIA